MRRPAVLLTLLLAGTLALAGCSGGSDGPEDGSSASPEPTATVPEPTEADVAALAAVTVEGALGGAPTLTFAQPFSVTAPVARADLEGTGAQLEDGQMLSVHYLMVDGTDGASLGSSWDAGAPEQLQLGDVNLIPALTEILRAAKVGARVLIAVPGGEATETTEAYPSMIMAMEILGVQPGRAQGEAVPPVEGLPTVTLDENGRPSIEVREGAVEPTQLVVQPLIKGSGPAVESGQNVVVHYNGWLWDGTLFDSSWDNGQPFPTPIGSGQLIPGWDQGLVGQTVGSQVLLVIPPELAYGAEGYNGIPPDATLIFVVDLLAAS